VPISGKSSVLLIGKNGSGKTTVGLALEILQRIARGTNRVADLAKPKDLARGRSDVPMRFEIEVELEAKIYAYELALEYPEGSKELRVVEERLTVDGEAVYKRKAGDFYSPRTLKELAGEGVLDIDWGLVALPIKQSQSASDPAFVFKQWLARMLILRPIPSLIAGDSQSETLEPNPQVINFGAWFSGLLAFAPSAYSKVDEYLKQVMPDLKDIKNPLVGTDSRSLVVQFSNDKGSMNFLSRIYPTARNVS
jgi:ABC-type oligopeptide transport system ATPase subunit